MATVVQVIIRSPTGLRITSIEVDFEEPDGEPPVVILGHSLMVQGRVVFTPQVPGAYHVKVQIEDETACVDTYRTAFVTTVRMPAGCETCTLEQFAQWLILERFVEVTQIDRTVARLPVGRTGMQALTAAATKRYPASKDLIKLWVAMLGEQGSKAEYLKTYAVDKDRRQVSLEVMNAFRAFGGGVPQ